SCSTTPRPGTALRPSSRGPARCPSSRRRAEPCSIPRNGRRSRPSVGKREVSTMVARRYIHSEPTSRLAIWAFRIAVFALVAAFLAVIIVRSGMLEIKPALATFAGALAIAVVALLVAFAAFAVIWMEGLAGMRAALAAMAIWLRLLAYPAYLGTKAHRLPWIHDITTDPIDPPRYEVLAPLRGGDANPAAYAGLYAAEQQRGAYPDIGPLGTNATAQAA